MFKRFSATLLLFGALALSTHAAETVASAEVVKIAVFQFELQDSSAAGGVLAQDERDKAYLAEATEIARQMLTASGKYEITGLASADVSAIARHGLRNCAECAGKLAHDLGGQLAMVGTVNRVGRTEYTVNIRILDAPTGKIVSSGSTGLRLGTRDSWPRGVKSLLGKYLVAETAK